MARTLSFVRPPPPKQPPQDPTTPPPPPDAGTRNVAVGVALAAALLCGPHYLEHHNVFTDASKNPDEVDKYGEIVSKGSLWNGPSLGAPPVDRPLWAQVLRRDLVVNYLVLRLDDGSRSLYAFPPSSDVNAMAEASVPDAGVGDVPEPPFPLGATVVLHQDGADKTPLVAVDAALRPSGRDLLADVNPAHWRALDPRTPWEYYGVIAIAVAGYMATFAKRGASGSYGPLVLYPLLGTWLAAWALTPAPALHPSVVAELEAIKAGVALADAAGIEAAAVEQ